MSNKPVLNMIGGGFQHAFSSCGWEHPREIVWDKSGHAGRISVHIDEAIFNIPPNPNKINVAWFCESPFFMTRWINMMDIPDVNKWMLERFQLVCCSYLDIIKTRPYMKYVPPHAYPWVEEKKIFPKTKSVSMIASAKNEAPGHKLRHMIAKDYSDAMDLFGGGYKPIKSKNEGLNDYMFSFAIENTQINGYFTEKITDCFATGTIPIYWGDPSIGDHFLTDGIVMLDENFDGSCLTQEFYESKMSCIKENFQRSISLPLPEDYMYEVYLKHL